MFSSQLDSYFFPAEVDLEHYIFYGAQFPF